MSLYRLSIDRHKSVTKLIASSPRPWRPNLSASISIAKRTNSCTSTSFRAASSGPDVKYASQTEQSYVQSFVAALRPIIVERDAVCLANSNKNCQVCGLLTTKVLQTPMSWLHIVEDPFINVWVNPVCAKSECEMQVQGQIQDMMTMLGNSESDEPPSREGGSQIVHEIDICRICGKTDDTKRCAKCGGVSYCSRTHQRADWKAHTKVCVTKA